MPEEAHEPYPEVNQRPIIRRVTIDASIIKRLKHMKNARPLSRDQVNGFLDTLRMHGFFESVMIVNEVADGRVVEGGLRWVLIDGGHRLRAIEMRLEEAPEEKIVVDFHIYKGLTKEQELVIFKRANRGRRVRPDNRLKIWSPFIPVLAMMDAAAPCKLSYDTLRPGEKATRYIVVLRAYLGRHNVVYYNATDIVAPLKKLGEEDARLMADFLRFMVSVFGEPVRESTYYKSVACASIAKVYFCNLGRFSQSDLVARFKSKVATDSLVRENMTLHAHSTSMAEQLTDMVVRAANKGFASEDKRLITAAKFKEQGGVQ